LSRPFRIIPAVLFCLALLAIGSVSSGGDGDKQRALPIPPHPRETSPPPKAESNFCHLQYDVDSVAYFSNEFEANDGITVLMDPTDCGFDSTYPFKISHVQFYLLDYEGSVWPAEIRVTIRNVYVAPDTVMPGSIKRYTEDFSVPQDFAWDPATNPYPIEVELSDVACVDTAFFLEITYKSGTLGSIPSVVMSDTLIDRPDTNQDWVLRSNTYREWYKNWDSPIPGRAIIRAIGYPYAIDCDKLCWEWMPDESKAPSGLPDFDQYQFGTDSVAMNGPAALADLLVWLNAIPSIPEPDSLMRFLAQYIHTDPSDGGGTQIDSIQSGLDSLFAERGLNLRDTVLNKPSFSTLADQVKDSISAALLLGFWQKIADDWYRIGGHYVSMAGGCKTYFWTAVSDPALDMAETGARGRFLPPHDAHPDDHLVHNTAGYVSHDAYLSDTLTVGPDSAAWILRDLLADTLPWSSQFAGLNFQPGQEQYAHPFDPAESLYAVVEQAVLILRTSTSVEEDEETAVPESFELSQSYPNPFNSQTVIRYSLFKPADVSLTIYNVLGQRVRTLVDRVRQNGRMTVIWDGKDDWGNDLASGIYFCRLQAGELSQTKRMVLLK
jgi:hypothetical protein